MTEAMTTEETESKQPSAKAARLPLLNVLGDLSNMTAGVEIDHQSTYAPVFKILGITDLEKYGKNNNQPLPERWVQWACKDLRAAGHVEAPRRGVWALTEKGVKELRSPTPLSGGITEDHESEPMPPVVHGQSLDVGPGHAEDYHPDPYIRSLALDPAITACFGSHLPTDGNCQTCPAKKLCINATALTFTQLTASLKAGDLEVVRKAEEERKAAIEAARLAAMPRVPNAAPTVAPSTPLPTPKAATAVPPVAAGVDLSDLELYDGIKSIKIAVATLCRRCGQSLEADTDAIWVRRKGHTNRNSTMMHPACFEATKAEAPKK